LPPTFAAAKLDRMSFHFRRSIRMFGARLDSYTKQPTPRTEQQDQGNGSTLLLELVALLAVIMAILLFSFR
jgi:hypothetical protein